MAKEACRPGELLLSLEYLEHVQQRASNLSVVGVSLEAFARCTNSVATSTM